ncbi:hypothetical protein Tco_0567137 [Tanacetum coccineum]
MIPLTIPSPVASPATAETKGFMTELGAQVQMHGGLIHDHAVRLEELSPALFERPVLALESWAGQTDAQRAALWHAINDIQGENRDLRLQLIEERRARLELAEVVFLVKGCHGKYINQNKQLSTNGMWLKYHINLTLHTAC